MRYTSSYHSSLGEILLAADDIGLVGLWFAGEKHFAQSLAKQHERRDTPALVQAKRWLDEYFSGADPRFTPPLHLIGTSFQQEVWEILRAIPYGCTTTYGAIAKEIARRRGIARMSAQAVGGAVGRNAISIIIPCHRVMGINGDLVGYAWGMERKAALLVLERSQHLAESTPESKARAITP